MGSSGYMAPVRARTRTLHHPSGPVDYDCVTLIFIRHGSAILLSEFGEKPVRVGDVVALAVNTSCGSEPEGFITATTLYLDRDYVVDQAFWQHAASLADRLDAQDFADKLYSEPAQLLHGGEDCVAMLMSRLHELIALSIDSPTPERFYRMQVLLFAVLNVVVPLVEATPVPDDRRPCADRPGLPRHRGFAPLSTEAQRASRFRCWPSTFTSPRLRRPRRHR